MWVGTNMNTLVLASGLSRRMGHYCQNYPKCMLKVAGKTFLEQLIVCLNSKNIFVVGRPNSILLQHYVASIKPSVTFLADDSGQLDYMGTLNAIHPYWKDGAWVISSDIWCTTPLMLMLPKIKQSILLYVHDPHGQMIADKHYPLDGIDAQRGLCIEDQSYVFTGIGYLTGPLFPIEAPATLSSYLTFLLKQHYPIYLVRSPWPIINVNTPDEWHELCLHYEQE